MSYYEKYIKQYQKTPRGKFGVQKANAKRRGIPWELTFEEWWDIWQQSGQWPNRGQDSSQFCMARKHDLGPYSVDNVKIITMKANSRYTAKRMHFKIN